MGRTAKEEAAEFCPEDQMREAFPYLVYERVGKMFGKICAKKMAGGRGEKPPCRVRLLKRRRYVWAVKNNVSMHNTSSKK
jgi:hypothetical protein